jgi:hypothetical protein
MSILPPLNRAGGNSLNPNSQHGAAATKRSRRNNCAGCRDPAVSRRTERADFVAQREDEMLGSGRTVLIRDSRTICLFASSTQILQYIFHRS